MRKNLKFPPGNVAHFRFCFDVYFRFGGEEIMENTITNKRTRAIICSLILTVALLFTFVIAPQFAWQQVYAADYEQWEDCDWDGFDDHTGVAVPWAGFDGTRGDTPAGASADSQSGKKFAAEKAAAEEKAAADKAAKEAKAKAAAEKAAKDKAAKDKVGDTTAKDKVDTKVKDTTTKENDSSSSATPTTESETNSLPLDADETLEAVDTPDVVDEAPVTSDLTPEQIQAELDASIIEQKGEIEIEKPEGEQIRPGGKITINGYGFYGDVAELEVEIHSTPTTLGKIATDDNGFFEITVTLPDTLEEGVHHILVLYQGEEISRQEIELAAPPANSFLKALLVGFDGNNSELFAGLVILGILVAIGVLSILIHAIFTPRRRKLAKEEIVA
jgi:hypothetical protein